MSDYDQCDQWWPCHAATHWHRADQDYLWVPLVFCCSNIILVMVYFIYPSEHHLILITALQAGIQPSNYPSNYPAAYRCG